MAREWIQQQQHHKYNEMAMKGDGIVWASGARAHEKEKIVEKEFQKRVQE